MRLRKAITIGVITTVFAGASVGVMAARRVRKDGHGKLIAALKNLPDFHAKAHGGPIAHNKANKTARSKRVLQTVLQFDDGTYETGLGVSSVGAFDGQIGMRFGGSAATTGAVPFQIQGAYFRFFPGFAGATNVHLNIWAPLTAGGFPTGAAPLAAVAGPTGTASTLFAGFPTGSRPTINTANGSVLAGIGVLGNTSWFVAGDNNGPQANRQFFGAYGSQNWTYGPTQLNSLGFAENFLIRLDITGNIPVELESFTIQ